MSNPDPLNTYLTDLRRNLATGAATEHTHRPALKALLQATGDGVEAINEPSRVECGAPDFIITRAQTPVGYVEAKDIGTDLNRAERSDQLKRYLPSLSNLILTDYLEFRWYVEGEHRESARLGTLTRDDKVRSTKAGVRDVSDLLGKFFAQEAPALGRPKELAERMASLARMTRQLIEETFKREGKEGRLHGQLMAFRETLIPELSPQQFADMYAQTITYGLFAARVHCPAGQEFTRRSAAWLLPPTNPFLRDLFDEIAGPRLDERISWLVDDLAYLLARADMSEVLQDFGKATKQEDPVVHFYETFLAAYNPEMRQRRGVYYTPEPVVSYIVRSIDHILKTTFNKPMGLADENVMILDPACGTGTFLYFVIQEIYETVCKTVGRGAWNTYVRDKLLPRIFGFELLMAPYAMAHMKLAVQLHDLGYDFRGDERLGVYLTNSLEEAITKAETLGFARFISEEADAAAEIKKDKPIMVVLGNPPYSVSSANREEVERVDKSGRRRRVKTHIGLLMDRYKMAVRDERNIQPLSDDYVKFIRFAHDRIERTGYGVIGMITNHSYLSGLIHRGIREELLKSFDEICVLNLHGNTLIGETPPDGGVDENVFDIRQGVASTLFVRRIASDRPREAWYADVWGPREDKYEHLARSDVSTIDWQVLEPSGPHFFLVPADFQLEAEYSQCWSLRDAFRVSSSGMNTLHDALVISFERDTLVGMLTCAADARVSDDQFRAKYRVKDSRDWQLEGCRKRAISEGVERLCDSVTECLYRPFDRRWIILHEAFVGYPRWRTTRSFLRPDALGLATTRQSLETASFLVSRIPLGQHKIVDPYHRSYVFALYLYHGEEDASAGLLPAEEVRRQGNLTGEFVAAVANAVGLDFTPDGKGDLENSFGPEDVFHYMYAVFHSPTYRERYAEFLRIDFPRLPLTSDLALFRALAEKGEELVALHLMESAKLNNLITTFPAGDSNEVDKVRYAEPSEDRPGRVYINETQYFEGVEPEVWEFHIGGYQVLHKWLKDRKGRKLSFDDLLHYQKIVVALKETMRLMEEIDGLIPSWPIE